MTHEPRDIELGAALEELPVPTHRPGFFEALTAQMSGEVTEVPALAKDHKGGQDMKTLIPKPGKTPPRIRFANRWAWAVAAAALVILAVGVVAVLQPGGGEFVDATPTTGAPTVTTPEPAPPTTMLPDGVVDLSGFVFPADRVPSFSATIVYDMNPLGVAGSIPAEAQLTVRVLFDDSNNYLYEVLSAVPATEAMHVFGAPGLTILRSPDQTWIKEPGDDPALPAGDLGPVTHLLWNTGYPAWDEICSAGFEAIGVETVAGRRTTHGRCADLAEDYDLWVDTETGIVMRLRGARGGQDQVPVTTREGGFQFIEFELGPVELPQAQQIGVAVDPSGLPPFHAVRVDEYQDPPQRLVQEIWYRDGATWRTEQTESNSEEFPVGYFDLMADGYLRGCDPSGPYCWEEENSERSHPLVPVPLDTLTEYCELAGEEEMLGRDADHFVCRVFFNEIDPGVWIPGEQLSQPSHYWVDRATGLQLRHEFYNLTESLVLFEINPLFPAGVFDYVPLTGEDGCDLGDPICSFWTTNSLVKGEPPPTFQGPLVDGTMLKTGDLRGRPAVILRWADVYTQGVLEQQLNDFQELFDKWGDQVGFLGWPDVYREDAERIVERGGYTFDNVICWENDGALCEPEDPGRDWRIGWGSWVILDENGNVFDGFPMLIGTFDHVDLVIEAVANS